MLEKKELLQSEAWQSLNGSSVKVYLFFRSKTIGPLRGTTATAKPIKTPYSIIAGDTGLSRQAVRNAIIELENKGFIDMTEQGGLKSGGYSMNTYALSTRFYKWGQPGLFEPGLLKKTTDASRGFGKAWKKGKYKK